MDSDNQEEGLTVKRGQYSKKYTEVDLQEAIEKIRNNEISYGAASQKYNVPKTTLHNKMRNANVSRRGAVTTLTSSQENELAEWILLHQQYGDPRTKHDMIVAAGEIAQLDNDDSKHFKNGLPTNGWVEGFLHRHPEIVYRVPEAISKASAINTKEDFSNLWRNIYSNFQKTNQLDLLYKPEHWWNADETNFPMDPMPKKVLARKGSKTVHRRDQGPPKANTTVTYAFSAAGDYVEPLLTLKDSISTIAEIAFTLGSVGANFGINQTDSGWMQSESFYYFVTMHLHKQWEIKNSPKPRILVIDGYKAHLNLRLNRWARLNDCIIIILYPNGTPYLQMCDTTMFRPMKVKHIELYQQWRLKNPTKTSDEVVLVKLLKVVNDTVIRRESIINGWRATGLQPFNFNNLNCDGLVSKSPDYLYDFKGDHINSTIETPIQKPRIDVHSCVVLDSSSEFYIEPGKLLSSANNGIVDLNNYDILELHGDFDMTNIDVLPSSYTDLTISPDNEISMVPEVQLKTVENCKVVCGTDLTLSLDRKSPESMDFYTSPHNTAALDDETSMVTPESRLKTVENLKVVGGSFTDLRISPESQSIADVGQCSSSRNLQNDENENLLQDEQSKDLNDWINLSELSGTNQIFRSQFETNFNLTTFGIAPDTKSITNGNKIAKLAEKIRRDVKEIALLCAASDKEKLLNVLIINQQMNVIDPPVVAQLPTENLDDSPTIKTILRPPTMPERAKPKAKRNIKVGYGVVTANEVIQQMEEREIAEAEQEIEREQDEINKNQRIKKIDEVDKQLQETRKLLTRLKSEHTAKSKEDAPKKKSRKRGGDDVSILEEMKLAREQEINDINERLKELRAQLQALKADNVAANKAIALKRKNFIALKKEKGNVVMPSTDN